MFMPQLGCHFCRAHKNQPSREPTKSLVRKWSSVDIADEWCEYDNVHELWCKQVFSSRVLWIMERLQICWIQVHVSTLLFWLQFQVMMFFRIIHISFVNRQWYLNPFTIKIVIVDVRNTSMVTAVLCNYVYTWKVMLSLILCENSNMCIHNFIKSQEIT